MKKFFMNLIGVEDKKKQKQIYTEYMTKQNETLEEIAIKFCPRKLKIPLQQGQNLYKSMEDIDITSTNTPYTISTSKNSSQPLPLRTLDRSAQSELLPSTLEKNEGIKGETPTQTEEVLRRIEKCEVVMITPVGEIGGLLTVTAQFISFETDPGQFQQLKNQDKTLRKFNPTHFQCRLHLCDILNIELQQRDNGIRYLSFLLKRVNRPYQNLLGVTATDTQATANSIVYRVMVREIEEQLDSQLLRISQKVRSLILNKKECNECLQQGPCTSFAQFSEPVEQFKVNDIQKYEVGQQKKTEVFQQIPKKTEVQQAQQNQQLTYVPSLHPPSQIINSTQVQQLTQHLPSHLRCSDWFLAFASMQHGHSYEQFLLRVKKLGPHLIILRDVHKTVFGAFLTQGWKQQKSERFYGSGESFLFTFKDNSFSVFLTTGQDRNFQLCDANGLMMGTGKGYGLFIKNDFLSGSSYTSETFENLCLATNNEFSLASTEIYAVDSIPK